MFVRSCGDRCVAVLFVFVLVVVVGLDCPVWAAESGKPSSQSTDVAITLGKPIVVSQSPPDLKGWGPWQFPTIERLADGRLHVRYHIRADSAKSYGLSLGHAVSDNGGKSWTLIREEQFDGDGGLLLPNGDRLRSARRPSVRPDKLSLPQPIGIMVASYSNKMIFYRAADMPKELAGWRFVRLAKGKTKWEEEYASVDIPGETRTVSGGVLTFPSLYQEDIRVAPDGSLWAVQFTWRLKGDVVQKQGSVLFFRSTDAGRSWSVLGEIPYQPDKSVDPKCAGRDGFTEPKYNFMPDGSVLCLMRTTDGKGVGPLYSSRSTDGGKTWEKPRVFDTCGVRPQLLTLQNGVTLAAYGRPGLFIRATADRAGKRWGPRTVVVEPGQIYKDTCSYSNLISVDERTALIVYSAFNYPGPQGKKRKTILVRTVQAE